MKTIPLGNLFGIPTRVHWTFWFLPIWIFATSLGEGSANAAGMVMFVFAIFGCVVLHELGHAVAARRFGIGTKDIVLYPIGGVASLKGIPRSPVQELVISVAGPLVNVGIALVLSAIVFLLQIDTSSYGGTFVWRLMIANVALVIFNMVPAFPMDGGRVLRSLLALVMEFRAASRVAVFAGRFFAIGFAVLGIVSGNVMLVFVAAFVYIAGQAELNALDREILHQRLNRRLPESRQPRDAEGSCVVPATLPVASVLSWLRDRNSETCTIAQAGKIIGKITKNQLIVAAGNGLSQSPVGNLVR